MRSFNVGSDEIKIKKGLREMCRDIESMGETTSLCRNKIEQDLLKM